MAEEREERQAAAGTGYREFSGKHEFPSNMFHGMLAVSLCFGPMHFNFFLLLLSFLFLPFPKFLMVVGFLLVFMVLPIDADSKFGRRLCSYICKHLCSYFPIILHVEDIHAFSPHRAYVLGYEPHSVLPIGAFPLAELAGLMSLTKMRFLASSVAFGTPFLRHIWTWLGVAPVSRKTFSSLLEAGYSCILVPGGVHETVLLDHASESHVYHWWKPGGNLFLQFSRALKFTPMLFWGIFGTPFPYQRPMHVVVGKPIELNKNPKPTAQEVQEVHGQFVKALQDLFDRHKARVGYANLQLRIL